MKIETKIINYAEGGTKTIIYDYDNDLWTWSDNRWTPEMIAATLERMAKEIRDQ